MMSKRFRLIAVAALCGLHLSGCAVAIGAGGAVAADKLVESEGGNLF